MSNKVRYIVKNRIIWNYAAFMIFGGIATSNNTWLNGVVFFVVLMVCLGVGAYLTENLNAPERLLMRKLGHLWLGD
jgi:hypothetical protein